MGNLDNGKQAFAGVLVSFWKRYLLLSTALQNKTVHGSGHLIPKGTRLRSLEKNYFSAHTIRAVVSIIAIIMYSENANNFVPSHHTISHKIAPLASISGLGFKTHFLPQARTICRNRSSKTIWAIWTLSLFPQIV